MRDNANWTEITRPILEAFFHAPFFPEMAVRYSELESPPSPLPSGYAAQSHVAISQSRSHVWREG